VFCGWFYECKPRNWALFEFWKSFLGVIKQFRYGPVQDVMTLLLFAKMKSLILEHHNQHNRFHRHLHHHREQSACVVTSSLVLSYVNPKMVSVCPKPCWRPPAPSHFTLPHGMPLVAGGLLTYFSGDFVNFVSKC
jgi:hypothetical protein